MTENQKDASSVKPETGNHKILFKLLPIITFCLLCVPPFLRMEVSDMAYRLGYAAGSATGIYLICFCLTYVLLLLVKNKSLRKKASILIIFLIALIYSCGGYFSYLSQASERQETKKNLINLANKEEITYDDIKTIKNPYINELMFYALKIEKSVVEYLNTSGLNGIIQANEENLIKSQEGLKTLYERGNEIISKIDNLDVKKDINAIYSDGMNEFYNDCIRKHPNQDAQCSEAVEGFKKGSEPNIEMMIELSDKKIKLIHAEYDTIKCMYENFGKNDCEDFVNKYMIEENKFNETMQKMQSAQRQNVKNKIKALDKTY